MSRIEVICNANAGRYRSSLPELRRMQAKWPNDLNISVTRSIDEIAGACTQAASGKPSVVGICGGDGTVTRVLTGLYGAFENLPPLLIIPGGTMNYLANHLCANLGNLESALEGSFQTSDHGCLAINNRIGFLFGTGFIPALLQRYETRKKNILNAVMTVIGMLAESAIPARSAFKLEKTFVNGQDCDYTVAFAGSYGNISFGIDIFPEASSHPDEFGYLIDSGGPASLLVKTAKLALGSVPSLVRYGYSSFLELQFQKPTAYTIDGELFSDECVRIRKDSVKIVV